MIGGCALILIKVRSISHRQCSFPGDASIPQTVAMLMSLWQNQLHKSSPGLYLGLTPYSQREKGRRLHLPFADGLEVTTLLKGEQMASSLTRARLLHQRVAESIPQVLSPDSISPLPRPLPEGKGAKSRNLLFQ
jgi:hypothetical protein